VGIWEQTDNDVRLDWGAEGVAALGRECAVLVVASVLRRLL
jgi:2-phosphosulfolactate phosphatase